MKNSPRLDLTFILTWMVRSSELQPTGHLVRKDMYTYLLNFYDSNYSIISLDFLTWFLFMSAIWSISTSTSRQNMLFGYLIYPHIYNYGGFFSASFIINCASRFHLLKYKFFPDLIFSNPVQPAYSRLNKLWL